MPRAERHRGPTASWGAAVLSLTLAAGGCAATEHPEAVAPPSFVLIVADDLTAGELGARGHPWIRTPELDALAAAGLSLERFDAAAPVCSPTRASLLTGRHPVRTRTFSWGHELPGEEITLAELLRARGYATGHFGKWHLGSLRAGAATSPGEQGFEEWASSPNFFDLDPLLSVGGEVVATHGEGSDVVTERALEFVREAVRAERPFLAVVWFASPHLPHVARDEDLAAFADAPEEVRAYCAEIAALDRNVGRLRRELRALGVAERTLLWFTSDNGPRAPGPAAEFATGGLRGTKGTLYEGGLRVPCLLEWPGTISAGTRSDAPAGTVDVLPTLLALAGVPAPADVTLDGVSLAPLLAAPTAPFERARHLGFWTPPIPGRVQHADRILAAQRAGEVHPEEAPPVVDLASLRGDSPPGHAAWIEGSWKLHAIPNEEGRHMALYDLETDPGERRDVAPEHPGLVARLAAALDAWQREVAADALGPPRQAEPERRSRRGP